MAGCGGAAHIDAAAAAMNRRRVVRTRFRLRHVETVPNVIRSGN